MNTIRDYKALSIVANVEQGEMIKRLMAEIKNLKAKNKNLKDFLVHKYDRLVELDEEICDNCLEYIPGYKEFAEILDKLVDDGLCKNTKYWSNHDLWEAERLSNTDPHYTGIDDYHQSGIDYYEHN